MKADTLTCVWLPAAHGIFIPPPPFALTFDRVELRGSMKSSKHLKAIENVQNELQRHEKDKGGTPFAHTVPHVVCFSVGTVCVRTYSTLLKARCVGISSVLRLGDYQG